jgi:hypothetical protein
VSKSKDETGNRYGSLTVLRRGDRGASGELKWWVRCDCCPDIEYQVSGLNLRTGNTQGCRRCGRKKRIVRIKNTDGTLTNLVLERRILIPIGTQFGNLVVARRGPDAERGHTQWWVRCDCGSPEKLVRGSKLRETLQSCGCLAGGLLLDGPRRKMFRQIRDGAKRRGLEWSLSEDQVYELTSKPCHYCGALPENLCKSKRQEGKPGLAEYTYNGIDRQDNSVGYTVSNCVPCCTHCNIAKRDRGYQEFIDWISKVSMHQSDRVS